MVAICNNGAYFIPHLIDEPRVARFGSANNIDLIFSLRFLVIVQNRYVSHSKPVDFVDTSSVETYGKSTKKNDHT